MNLPLEPHHGPMKSNENTTASNSILGQKKEEASVSPEEKHKIQKHKNAQGCNWPTASPIKKY